MTLAPVVDFTTERTRRLVRRSLHECRIPGPLKAETIDRVVSNLDDLESPYAEERRAAWNAMYSVMVSPHATIWAATKRWAGFDAGKSDGVWEDTPSADQVMRAIAEAAKH